jgi:hypothetical protein
MARVKYSDKVRPLVFIFIFSLLFLSASTYVVFAAIEDASTLGVRFELSKKKELGSQLSAIELKQFQFVLGEAANTMYDAPHYSEDLGYLNVEKGYAARRFSFISKPLLESAAVHYRKALSTRPMAPVDWANIALIHHNINNVEALWREYEIAMLYGKNDPPTQLVLLIIARQRWSELSESKRASVTSFLKDLKGPAVKQGKAILDRYPISENDH